MVQNIDHMEASCVFYVKGGMLEQCEQSKVCVLTLTLLGITTFMMQQDCIFGMVPLKITGMGSHQ